jgi:hypothetical protein
MSYRPIPPAQARYRDSGQRQVTLYRDPKKSEAPLDLVGVVERLSPADRGRLDPATHRVTTLYARGIRPGSRVLFHHDETTASQYEVLDVRDPFASAAPGLAPSAVQPTMAPGQFRASVSAAVSVPTGAGYDQNAGKFLELLVKAI